MAYGQNQQIRDLPPEDMAPVLEWDDFLGYVFDPGAETGWQQDQHVGLIGPTDSGKSTLLHGILPLRSYVTLFGTKIQDKTLDSFVASGEYERIKDWPPYKPGRWPKRELTAEEMPRRLLWPDVTSIKAVPQLAPVFDRAIDDLYRQGKWCVVWDEFWMMCDILDLRQQAKIFLQQARSNEISFVMGMQRPSWIPPEVFDQTRHLFFWRDNDELNLKRIGGIGWLAAGPIRAFVANLDPWQTLYVNNRTGHMYRTTAPSLS